MATPYIMPLGFIYRPTEDGAIITLTDPRDSLGLKLATPVTIWRYSQGQLATAKIRGQVTAVGYMTATFKTVESRIDPRWPTSRQLLRPKTPVYLAMPDSFEPDMSRKLTQEQVESMQRAAARYTEITRPTIPNQPNLNPPNEPKNAKTKHHKPQGLSIVADRRRYLAKSGDLSDDRLLGAPVGSKAKPDNRMALIAR